MADVVRTIRIRGQSEGLDEITAKLRKAQDAAHALADAEGAMATAAEQASTRMLSATQKVDRVVQKYDETARAQARFTREMDILNRGLDAGAFGRGAAGAEAYARAVNSVAKEFERVANAPFERALSRAQALTKSLLPDAGEMARTREVRREILTLEDAGALSRARAITLLQAERRMHADNLDLIRKSSGATADQAKQAGLARHEWINLGRQAQDVAVSLASGQSVFTVAMQQGSQIADALGTSSGGFAGGLRAIGGLITPARLAMGGLATAVLAGAAAWNAYDNSQRSVALRLEGIGRGSGMMPGDVNAIAGTAQTSRMSVSQARDVASSIAGTGRIDRSLVGKLTDASYGFSLLTGKSVSEAGADLAAAFADPVRGAEELNKRLGFLNGGLQDYIRNAVAAGDRTAAQKAMYDAVTPAIARATEHTNAFAKAWHSVWNFASNAADAIGRAVAGPSTGEQLRRVEQQIEQAKQSGGLLFGFGPTGLPRLERQRDALRVQADYEKRQAESLRREQQANELGLSGNSAVRSIVEDIQRLESLRGNKSIIERLIGDPEAMAKSGRSADEAAKALGNVNGMLSVFASAAQRAAEDGQLQVRSIMALTLAERAAVEAQRAWLDVMRQSGDAAAAAAQAEAARNRVIAEANRQARDMLRDANLDAKLVGLTPYQRGLQQIRNDRFRDMQQNGGGAGVVGAYGPEMPGGVDSTFRSKVAALIEAVGDAGARMTSGFRTREKQQELYDYYGPGRAARPGSSQHEHGTAMDYVFLSPAARARAMELAGQYGVRALSSNGGAVHFDMGRGGRAANDNGARPTDRVAAWDSRESSYAAEQQTGPLVQARLATEAQMRTLELYRQAAFATGAQQAELNEKMRLYADFARNGVPVTGEMRAKIDEMAASAGRLAGQMQAVDFAKTQFNEWGAAERDGVKGFFSDLINSARQGEFSLKSVGQAFTNLISKLADKSVNMLIDRFFFGMNGGNSGGGLLGAIFGGVGGGGGSRTGGLYAEGGYTGRGGKYEPAGIVHRGEYVFDAAATSRIGVHALEAMRRGLPGYADGGYVSAPAAVAPPSIPTANSNSPASITINVTGATGNEEVKRMVAAGMQQAFQMSQADTKRNAVNYFRDAQVRYG